MNDQQWAEAVALAIQRFHNGTTTEEQMSAEIATATANWPTRTLSNAGLAIKISRSLASLTGLVETVGPPDPDMGTLGAMAFDNQALAFYGPKTEAGWGDARPIDAGPPGPAIEMRVSGGFIQWRVEGEASWISLIAIADLKGDKGDKGDDGEEVSLQKTATHIQWRLGTGAWQNLVALSDLVGPKGDKGDKGDQGDVGPTPDISFTASTGAPGSSASVTKSGTLEEPVFALTVPRGDVGPVGGDAWTPVLATVTDGERRVQQIVDWFGGGGTKPDVGKYIGSSGLVDTAAEATDIRGAGGSGSGDVMGPGSSVDGGLVAFDGSTGTKIKAGPGVGVANAGDLLRRSDGDSRYRAAGSIPIAEVSGLQSALDGKQDALGFTPADAADTYTKGEVDAALEDKADLVGGKVPIEQLPAMSGGGLEVGDILTTARDPGAEYLLTDGSSYLRTAWPELSPLLPDGGNVPFTGWTARTLPPSTSRTSVTYGNGIFVAVANGGSAAATSPDGINWTARTLPSSANWQSVTYGNGLFVAVTNGGASAATSPDGINWTARTLPSLANWFSVTYGNGLFVAVAYGSASAATSPDGINWTARTLPSSANWQSVTYGNGIFVAVARGSASAATSPDGINWTARTLPSSANWRSVTHGNGLFVALVYGDTSAATSPDGINWTARTLPSLANWQSVTYGNGLFVAVAYGGTSSATSPDGINWTARTLPSSANWQSVTYGNGIFVAVTEGAAAATSNKLTDPTLFAVPRITGDDVVKHYIKGEA